MESEVRKEETTSRDCLVQFLFVFLKKKKNTFPFLMVIHACPFNFLMQSYHMTMLTIFKLWAVGSTPFPTLALDFADLCPQYFLGNFGLQEGRKLHTTLYIFTRLLTRQDGLQNRDSFSALLPISPPFE